MDANNHRDWIEFVMPVVAERLGINPVLVKGMEVSDGDKTEQYRDRWESAGLDYRIAAVVYCFSKVPPYSQTCRQTQNGFVEPVRWVIDNYKLFYEECKTQAITLGFLEVFEK